MLQFKRNAWRCLPFGEALVALSEGGYMFLKMGTADWGFAIGLLDYISLLNLQDTPPECTWEEHDIYTGYDVGITCKVER